VPEFSRRAQLAPLLVSADQPHFRRNLANRLWALLMGRGLVHPLDLDHEDNPPSHAELLTLLGDELAAMKYDVRAFLRELARSETYQRSSEPPPGKPVAEDRFAVALLRPLSAEQLAWSLLQATGVADVERKALGKNADEAALRAKLAGSIAAVVATFGGPPGRPASMDFEPSLEKTLFLTNGSRVRSWLTPSPAGNLTGRLARLTDPAAVADELYLSILTRRPSEEECRVVANHLKDRIADRDAALQELAWALLTSVEFHFNH
jgi:hypothetical protein